MGVGSRGEQGTAEGGLFGVYVMRGKVSKGRVQEE